MSDPTEYPHVPPGAYSPSPGGHPGAQWAGQGLGQKGPSRGPGLALTLVGVGIMLLAGVIFIAPYGLFLVGGGGDTTKFHAFAHSFVLPALVLFVVGVGLLAVGIVQTRRATRAARNAPPMTGIASVPPAGVPSAGNPYGYGVPAVSPAPPGKNLGIVAFVLSLTGWVIPFGIVVAVVLGHVARSQSKKAGHPNNLALAAIIISWSVIAIVATFLIVFAIAGAPTGY